MRVKLGADGDLLGRGLSGQYSVIKNVTVKRESTDRPDWSWYGLIAEDLAEIDPRLVQWGYRDEDYDEIERVDVDADGAEKRWIERVLKPGAVKVPDGVQYERLSVLLLSVVQRLAARVSALETQRGGE